MDNCVLLLLYNKAAGTWHNRGTFIHTGGPSGGKQTRVSSWHLTWSGQTPPGCPHGGHTSPQRSSACSPLHWSQTRAPSAQPSPLQHVVCSGRSSRFLKCNKNTTINPATTNGYTVRDSCLIQPTGMVERGIDNILLIIAYLIIRKFIRYFFWEKATDTFKKLAEM